MQQRCSLGHDRKEAGRGGAGKAEVRETLAGCQGGITISCVDSAWHGVLTQKKPYYLSLTSLLSIRTPPVRCSNYSKIGRRRGQGDGIISRHDFCIAWHRTAWG